jgi:hypothetical protein
MLFTRVERRICPDHNPLRTDPIEQVPDRLRIVRERIE